jgi:hypothetical protein
MSHKGRDPELIRLRNMKLTERFYYWHEVRRLRYDDVIAKLSLKEFFIGEQSIIKIIKDNNDYLNSMIKASKPIKQLTLFSDEIE